MYRYLALLLLAMLIVLFEMKEYTGSSLTKCHDHDSCCDMNKILDHCRVPTLTQQQCFEKSEYNVCPRYNGSYMQCTNNNIPLPDTNNCECNNRTFEMCSHKYKVSEKCVYDKIDQCLKDDRKRKEGQELETDTPRVNLWNYEGVDKGFMVQCDTECPVLY